MPEKTARARAAKDKRAGKSSSTQAGEFVRDEIRHVRAGKHGARSTKQLIAIGLSKARRAGVQLPASDGASAAVRAQAKRDAAFARDPHAPSPARSRASRAALAREGSAAATRRALSRHARSAARARRNRG